MNLSEWPALDNTVMIALLTIAYYLQAYGVYAQLANTNQGDKSCRDLGHCRSIWDIAWSCITTIFACTWLAVHMNVPEQGKGRLWKFGRRVGAFVFALIAPEVIIADAWDQRASAKKIARDHKDDHWTITHGFFVIMGGFIIQDGNRMYVLEPDEIGVYLRNGQINITEEQIQDRSKGDSLTKGFVILQTTWFILQLIARAIENLPITELEFSTLAFAMLNAVTHVLWWNKPLDVQCPIILTQYTSAGNIEAGANGSIAGSSMGREHTDEGMRARLIDQPEKQREEHLHHRVSSVSFLSAGVDDQGTSTSAYILAGIGLLFGSIHCIAWVSHFPTAPEKLLWQISSIATIAIPTMYAVWNFADDQVRIPNFIENTVLLVLFVLYPIARLFLLVLAFTTLRSLPPDAYATVHWTTFIPHI